MATAFESVLECVNLTSGYDYIPVVNDISLAIKPRQVCGLLGRNGAGKTTLLNTLLGFIRPMCGHVRLFGQDLSRMALHRIAQQGVSYVPDTRGLFQHMTVAENLKLCQMRFPNSLSIENVLDLATHLRGRLNVRAGNLSGGEQQMLAIAQSVIVKPRLLVVDEFSEGLQPDFIPRVIDFLHSLREETGMAMLVVEQRLRIAQALCDWVFVMEKGSIVMSFDMTGLEGHMEAVIGYLAFQQNSQCGPITISDTDCSKERH